MRASFPSRLRIAARLFLWLEDWLVPPVCVHCGARRRASLPLCFACLRALGRSRPEEEEVLTGHPWIRALFRLTPPLQTLIHGFKYRHQRRHIAFLCAYLRWRGAWIRDLGNYDALIAVPLHPARRRERGYNQAEILARAIARPARRPVAARGIRRVRFTGTQTRLRDRDRAKNLAEAFRADARFVAGKKLLLIDDVCTTASTLTRCRDTLLEAGAARVDALVLAWVEKRPLPKPALDLEVLFGSPRP